MIYLYDHTARRLNRIELPHAIDNFGFSEREVYVLKPLMLAINEVRGLDPALALTRLSSLTWGFGRRMVSEGKVDDLRIILDPAMLLSPTDPLRVALFVKFLYKHQDKRRESRFILALSQFDLPDPQAASKL